MLIFLRFYNLPKADHVFQYACPVFSTQQYLVPDEGLWPYWNIKHQTGGRQHNTQEESRADIPLEINS